MCRNPDRSIRYRLTHKSSPTRRSRWKTRRPVSPTLFPGRAPINRRRGADIARTVHFTENVFYRFDGRRIARVWSVIDKAAIEAQL